MTDYNQLGLFPEAPREEPQQEQEIPQLDESTALEEAIAVYLRALRRQGRSPYTIKAFRSDLGLLAGWAGEERAVGSLGTSDLNRFLHWMVAERDKPCSPKTYARRVTALKNFFNFLHTSGALRSDPSAPIIQKPVKSKLPEFLFDSEVERVLSVTESLRRHANQPDARPHMLITLLLETGIKKGEAMALRPEHIVRTHPDHPVLWVRYQNPRLRYKERRIMISTDWLAVFDEYLVQRNPQGTVFDCTARNLEYVLRDVAQAAGLPPNKLSFETLRWTCAIQDYLSNMDLEALREKLGLSRVSWRETSIRLAELAKRADL